MQETQETRVRTLGQEDPLEEEMAPHSSVHTWRIPQTEEPAGLQSIESHRVRHDLATGQAQDSALLESSRIFLKMSHRGVRNLEF